MNSLNYHCTDKTTKQLSLIENYKNRFLSKLHSSLFTDEYQQKLYAIISSFDDTVIPNEIIFIILTYYGFGGKWINNGIITNFNMEMSDDSSLAYDPFSDEYVRKDWTSCNIIKYKLNNC